MQSYLAYRRFGRHVQAQYDRDKHRAEAMGRGNAETFPSSSHSPSHSQETTPHHALSIKESSSQTEIDSGSPDSRDLEEGDQPPSSDRNETSDAEQEGEENGNENTISRNSTLQQSHTNQSFGTRMGHAMTGVEVRALSQELTKRRSRASSTGEKSEANETVFVVGYESPSDTMNPHNWSFTTRLLATALVAAIGFIVGFASSVDSAAAAQAAAEFGLSEVTESLATGLFLIGFGFGALFAGPISETVGRNPVCKFFISVFECCERRCWTLQVCPRARG